MRVIAKIHGKFDGVNDVVLAISCLNGEFYRESEDTAVCTFIDGA